MIITERIWVFVYGFGMGNTNRGVGKEKEDCYPKRVSRTLLGFLRGRVKAGKGCCYSFTSIFFCKYKNNRLAMENTICPKAKPEDAPMTAPMNTAFSNVAQCMI